MKKQRLPLVFTLVLLVLAWPGCSSDPAEAGQESDRVGLLVLDTFLTNINDSSGERYCKLGIKLAIAPEDEVAKIQSNPLLVARIRDSILTLLTAKTFRDLNGLEGREGFREEIRTRVTEILEHGEIKEVLFSEFVVQ